MMIWHRIYAWVFGYFDGPCPICKRRMFGHQWKNRNGLPSSIPDLGKPGHAWGICPGCTRAGYGFLEEGWGDC